ncbi:hypothetical protein L3X38_023933 [Prunus dulcis]|uniref:DRBM domain-containing protein n=1 Tax=Prunus dulcis TaxID=3755 RepID=A0AAD4Z5Y1_PRUDU|nr:hypothetical protein L3X38_023933 [Prunus dulcis]
MAINSATPLPSLNQYYVWDMLKFGQRYRVQYCVHSGSAVGNNMSFRIEEAIHGLHVLCVKKRLPKPPEYKEENVFGPPHEKKYVYSVKVVTSDGTVQSVMGDEKSRKKKAMNSASYKMILALQQRS